MDIIRKLELIPTTVEQGKVCHKAIDEIESLRSQLSSKTIYGHLIDKVKQVNSAELILSHGLDVEPKAGDWSIHIIGSNGNYTARIEIY